VRLSANGLRLWLVHGSTNWGSWGLDPDHQLATTAPQLNWNVVNVGQKLLWDETRECITRTRLSAVHNGCCQHRRRGLSVGYRRRVHCLESPRRISFDRANWNKTHLWKPIVTENGRDSSGVIRIGTFLDKLQSALCYMESTTKQEAFFHDGP